MNVTHHVSEYEVLNENDQDALADNLCLYLEKDDDVKISLKDNKGLVVISKSDTEML